MKGNTAEVFLTWILFKTRGSQPLWQPAAVRKM